MALTAKRYLEIQYPNDKYVVEFCEISKQVTFPSQQQKLLAILEAFAQLPVVVPDNHVAKVDDKLDKVIDTINVTTNITNTNSQTQSQKQSLAVQLFIKAIKDDLTGRQIKELKAVVEDTNNDLQMARSGIIAKLKEFDTDVASNIVANLLINPMIWDGL